MNVGLSASWSSREYPPFTSKGTSVRTRSAMAAHASGKYQHLGRSGKILDCQPGELGPGLLGDLPLDRRDHHPKVTPPASTAKLRHRMAEVNSSHSARNGSSG
jgi:hypothetical protein